MAVFEHRGLRHFRREYERGSEEADKQADKLLRVMTPRGLLNYVCEEIHEELELWATWEEARMVPSPEAVQYLMLLTNAVQEINNTVVQDGVLKHKGLSVDLPDALSSAVELQTLRRKMGAQEHEDEDCLLQEGKFLAYVTSVTMTELEVCHHVEDATGIPSARVIAHLRVLLQVARQARILALTQARSVAKTLAIEFSDVLVRAIQRGDCERVFKILDRNR